MTQVRLGHRPEEVVDLDGLEIEDLKRLGVKVQEVGVPAEEVAEPSETKAKGSK